MGTVIMIDMALCTSSNGVTTFIRVYHDSTQVAVSTFNFMRKHFQFYFFVFINFFNEVVRIKGTDPVHTILDFARSHGVGQIIIGRSHQPWWRQLFGRSVPLRLVKEGSGLDLHIVSIGEDEMKREMKPQGSRA